MIHPVQFEDLGLREYGEVWNYQEACFDRMISRKIAAKVLPSPDPQTHHLIFVEHPHVYTLGKSAQSANLLISEDFLATIQAVVVRTNRGGDITYHGPGQLVGYPIFDLEALGCSIRGYIELLEEAIIRTIAAFGIKGHRLAGATGVWLDPDHPHKARKISAIGVRASRYVTMHGFALNINTNLNYFQYINPCGFVDKGVTSLQKELGEEVPASLVKAEMKQHMQSLFHIKWVD